ncbi:hypothetical protein PM082_010252 [Marasmius tenuissimus]|nr:hypothetical protein PM082_010252 [Marasmius tenuissimus]
MVVVGMYTNKNQGIMIVRNMGGSKARGDKGRNVALYCSEKGNFGNFPVVSHAEGRQLDSNISVSCWRTTTIKTFVLLFLRSKGTSTNMEPALVVAPPLYLTEPPCISPPPAPPSRAPFTPVEPHLLSKGSRASQRVLGPGHSAIGARRSYFASGRGGEGSNRGEDQRAACLGFCRTKIPSGDLEGDLFACLLLKPRGGELFLRRQTFPRLAFEVR